LFSSMMTHSELPVKGSSLSWNMRCEEVELMVLMKVSLEEEDKGWLGFWKRLVFVDNRSRRSI
jgi:hypothetical protein